MVVSETSRNTKGEFDRLTRIGPGTPMGNLLRRFWQPVARSEEVAVGRAKALRFFDEELTLYRGSSGTAYLVAGRCAHRRTRLHTGWVQGEEIRCVYHGWKYDGTGQCKEMPSERAGLCRTVRIAGYPVHEYAGLVFAYMGEGKAPEFELPRKDVFERSDRLYFTRVQKWPCNWLQQVENSLDALHVSFVHQKGKVGPFGEAVTPALPELDYQETDAGIRQIATRGMNNVRISDWTFPNNNHIIIPSSYREDPWIDLGLWIVPNDDENTTRFQLYSVPYETDEAKERITAHYKKYAEYTPAEHHDELFDDDIYPEDPLLELTNAQDYVAAVGQGTIADRPNERLASSDAGIVLLRRILKREMSAIENGGIGKEWRRLPHAVELPIQQAEMA